MTITPDQLYELLPAIYRVRDAERGEPLKALLSVMAAQINIVEEDIDQLYENWFIETCEEWLVPYIGDLLGVRPLQGANDEAFSQRAYVANTLSYRRRKGTLAVLEELVRDVTAWPAKAVEFFELLAATQHLQHLRPGKGGPLQICGKKA
ncbi:MAG: phage tail protein, partial [Smithellaceae bacterium]